MADPRHLLYTDFDGDALDTPAPLVGRGLVDDRHLDRVPGLAAVIDDPTADPSDRLYACLALTAWGEERGYRAVEAAAGPAPPPWRGLPRAPFGLVAAQVGISDAMAERKGTEAARARRAARPRRRRRPRGLRRPARRRDLHRPPVRGGARRRRRDPARPAAAGPAPVAVVRPAVPARRHPRTAGGGGRADRTRAGRRDRAARPQPSHAGLRGVPRRDGHHPGRRRAGGAHRRDRRPAIAERLAAARARLR